MNSKFIVKIGVVVASLMIVQNAQAAVGIITKLPTPTPTSQNASSNISLYRQLDELRSQNAVLTESLKNAELMNKISNVGKKPAEQISPAPGNFSGMPNNAYPVSSSAPLSGQVQMVSGSGKNLSALISLQNGGRVTARVGSNISGLGVVKSISLNEVVVANKTQTFILPFATDTFASTPSGSPSSSMMPGMMPGGLR